MSAEGIRKMMYNVAGAKFESFKLGKAAGECAELSLTRSPRCTIFVISALALSRNFKGIFMNGSNGKTVIGILMLVLIMASGAQFETLAKKSESNRAIKSVEKEIEKISDTIVPTPIVDDSPIIPRGTKSESKSQSQKESSSKGNKGGKKGKE